MDELVAQLQNLSTEERITFLDAKIRETSDLLKIQGFNEDEILNIQEIAYFDIQKVIPDNVLIRQLIEYRFFKKLIVDN